MFSAARADSVTGAQLLSWHKVTPSRTEVLWLDTTLGTHVVEIVDERYEVLAGPALPDQLIAQVNAERALLAAYDRNEPKVPLLFQPRLVLETCEGCEKHSDTKAYNVTSHAGSVALVWYCDDCADLAACDWNGETAAIAPLLKEAA
jgi:hypothetical protein